MTGHARTKRTIQRAREDFIAGLTEGLSITGACMKANVPRQTAYDWRKADEAFRAEWDDALDAGSDVLEDEAFRRAYHGFTEPVVAQGRLAKDEDGNVLTVRKYSDTLMCLLLKGRKPDRFRERAEVKNTGDPANPVVHKIVREIVDPAKGTC
jgi:hypothetical protein